MEDLNKKKHVKNNTISYTQLKLFKYLYLVLIEKITELVLKKNLRV